MSDPITRKRMVQFTFHTVARCPPFLSGFNAPDSRSVGLVESLISCRSQFDPRHKSSVPGWSHLCLTRLSTSDLHLIVAILGFFKSTNVERHHLFTSPDSEQQAWCAACWQSLARHLLVGGFDFSIFKQVSQHWRYFKVQIVPLATMVLSLLSFY